MTKLPQCLIILFKQFTNFCLQFFCYSVEVTDKKGYWWYLETRQDMQLVSPSLFVHSICIVLENTRQNTRCVKMMLIFHGSFIFLHKDFVYFHASFISPKETRFCLPKIYHMNRHTQSFTIFTVFIPYYMTQNWLETVKKKHVGWFLFKNIKFPC